MLEPTIIKLDQGTDAWHQWRCQGIGSSDAPIIVEAGVGGKIKKSRQQLLEEKRVGFIDDTWKYIFEKGHRFEAAARARYNLFNSTAYQPVCLEMYGNSDIHASLDGWDAEAGKALEIKYVGKAWIGEDIPVHHVWQLMHEMMVSGVNEILYIRGCDNKDVLADVRTDGIKPGYELWDGFLVNCLWVQRVPEMIDKLMAEELKFLKEWKQA